ncbi:MAG: hypothetical protein D5R99_06355 [Methanocalculus sp. MSAO_Arc1]|uniref:hypothetical protein n=1 Tax=Methanocalculus TaxID=71151 RepID=UPI000FF58C9D|nr:MULTISPECIES: hypothetical protein [unclassified Methanocalculus]MCP1661872.1 hypothetical protein [Methanocalculus sp. AMF5]RQD80020.1 MAG: hypothetical protein D5R99_06355 [Methanocalculus sp. MSAO_Arc1]
MKRELCSFLTGIIIIGLVAAAGCASEQEQPGAPVDWDGPDPLLDHEVTFGYAPGVVQADLVVRGRTDLPDGSIVIVEMKDNFLPATIPDEPTVMPDGRVITITETGTVTTREVRVSDGAYQATFTIIDILTGDEFCIRAGYYPVQGGEPRFLDNEVCVRK